MSADLLKRLIEAGTPAELIAEVAMLAADAAALQRRRNSDRERQASHRNVTSRDSADVTGETPSPLVPPKVSPTPPSNNPPISPNPVCSSGAGRFHRMPEGWRPSKPIPTPLQAKIDLWPPGAFEDEVAALKRWAANAENKNGKGKKLDWDKALWTWLGRRHDERYSRQPANNNHGSKTAAALDILARLDSASHAQAGHG